MTVDEERLAAENLAADAAAAPTSAVAAPVESIGLALSGGGIRAALFSVGVLIGLVDSGEHRKVTNVTSVSGGSIVNAAVAQTCELSAAESTDEFAAVVRPIATALCRSGAFVFSRGALWALAKAIGPRIGGIAAAVVILWSVVAGALEGQDIGALPWLWIGIGIGVLVVAGLWLSRGQLQEALYRSLLGALPGGRSRKRLTDFRESPTTHVIVATDLVTGSPVYFSREFVCCPSYGWGTPGRTLTASAVYASAAFPVVFPVRRFGRRRFGLQNGMIPPPYPRRLKLNDGGVYNNLGTDWFDEIDAQSRSSLWSFGNLPLQTPLTPVTRRLVVNAGAASRGVRRVPPFLALSRTMSVLYDNTVRPRLQTMRDRAMNTLAAPLVIDISESPYNIARRLSDIDVDAYPDGERERAELCRDRAIEVADQLVGRGEPYWIEFARQTSSTPTKLTRAGLESGARMMLHGYLSTVVALHIVHGAELPKEIKDEGYFLDLAGRRGSVVADTAGQPDLDEEDEATESSDADRLAPAVGD
jgi:predicted acylesterase/phospholipase RssA